MAWKPRKKEKRGERVTVCPIDGFVMRESAIQCKRRKAEDYKQCRTCEFLHKQAPESDYARHRSDYRSDSRDRGRR